MPLELTPKQPPYYETGTGGQGAKAYRAILNQTGTTAPIATTLINSLQVNNWTRNGVGDYQATTNEPYLTGKVWMAGQGRGGAFATTMTLTNLSSIQGYAILRTDIDGSGNILLTLETYDEAFILTEFSSLISQLSLPDIIVYN